jgi:uncharacterized protein
MVNPRFFVRRLTGALRRWPDVAGWWFCAGVSVVALVVIAIVAGLSGLARWHPDFAGWPLRLGMIMLVPALSEELVFRGLLTPTRGESQHDGRWIASGLLAFVVWHVVEAMTFLPGAARLFLRLDFLFCAGVLGAACAIMRYRTGSLWPGVLLHGVTVFIWQATLGGPGFARLVVA